MPLVVATSEWSGGDHVALSWGDGDLLVQSRVRAVWFGMEDVRAGRVVAGNGADLRVMYPRYPMKAHPRESPWH